MLYLPAGHKRKTPTVAESHNCLSAVAAAKTLHQPISAISKPSFIFWDGGFSGEGPSGLQRAGLSRSDADQRSVRDEPPRVQFPVLLTADHCQGRLQQVPPGWGGRLNASERRLQVFYLLNKAEFHVLEITDKVKLHVQALT